MNEKNNIVIIGGGPSGHFGAAAACRNADVTLICKEKQRPYWRPRLTSELNSEEPSKELFIKDEKWYQEHNVKLLFNAVVSIDITKKVLSLDDSSQIHYDKLIIAAGASPFIPDIPGGEHFLTLRTTDDARLIRLHALETEKALIIGGGILSMETACELAEMGSAVTILERASYLMPRQLGEAASAYLKSMIEAKGIRVLVDADAKDFLSLSPDCTIVQAGVRADVKLALDAGICVKSGIIVNDRMQAAIPDGFSSDIFACGDIAEFDGQIPGLLNVAMRQGTVAGNNAVGNETRYVPAAVNTMLKVKDISLFSIGSPIGKSICESDASGFRCVTIAENEVVGASLIGDIKQSSILKKAVDQKLSVENGASYADIIRKLQ